MGDRANVAIVQYDNEQMVYLYTHWGGEGLPHTVQKALAKKWRWDDGIYLARIIFDQMINGNQGSETGFGISTTIGDNEHPIIVVNPREQKVGFAKEGREPKCVKQWSFGEYVALSKSDLEKEYHF